jgi:hypothetical protein
MKASRSAFCLSLFFSLVLMISLFPGAVMANAAGNDVSLIDGETNDAVNFPDANLEAVIRTALNMPEGQILRSNLAVLNSLSAMNKGIVNLEGIEYCQNLAY